jgi:hypothetical protein
MKASKFSDAQKAFILKQGNDGMPVADVRNALFDVGSKEKLTNTSTSLKLIRKSLVLIARSRFFSSASDSEWTKRMPRGKEAE